MTHTIIHDHQDHWQGGTFDSICALEDGSQTIGLVAGQPMGVFTSATLFVEEAASEAILCVNVSHASNRDSSITASLSCSEDGQQWSDWFDMFTWGPGLNITPEDQSKAGHVAVDTLQLFGDPHYWRYRLTVQSKQSAIRIRRVALSLWSPNGFDSSQPSGVSQEIRLDVPFVSQYSALKHDGARLCSPAVVTMLCGFYGQDVNLDSMADEVFDPVHEIYGNWPLNMMAASLHNLCAYIDRGESMLWLEQHLAKGHPVAASIAFEEGALAGAPVPESKGHLVVVAGFSKSGDPIVRDPAAKGTDSWITYNRNEFATAWLNHGGVAYRVEPETR